MLFHQLVYTSRSVVDVTEEVLLDILAVSQRRNYELKLSGLLAYHEGKFIQLLEGRKEQVQEIFISIQNDQRHTDVQVVLEADSSDRCMPMWVMGFTMYGVVYTKLESQQYFIPITRSKELSQLMPGMISREFQKFWDASVV